MKQLLVAASAAVMVCGAFAQEAATANSDSGKPELEEKEDSSPLATGFDADFFTAYVWRNAVQNDRAVAQPCVWADFTVADPFYVGFYVWQNYDLTGRRRGMGYRGEWNETDYNVHAGTVLWASDDEETMLNFELGHEWYTYTLYGSWGEEDGGYRKRKDFPTTYEMYLKLDLDNPYVTPYTQISYEYNVVEGVHYELGLRKAQALSDLLDSENDVLSQLTLSADVNLNFGTGRYLTYLYDGDGEDEGKCLTRGIGGITAKTGLTWKPCEHFSIGGVLAFTSILNGDARDEFNKMDDSCNSTDLVWGGIQAKLSF